MSLLPFLLITTGGAVASLLLRHRAGLRGPVDALALTAGTLAAVAIVPGQTLDLGGTTLGTTDYGRLFLALGSLVGLGLWLVGLAAGSRRDAGAVTLAILATSGLALALDDPRPAFLVASAGGAVGALLTTTPHGGRAVALVGIPVLRATVVAGVAAIVATAWIGSATGVLEAGPVSAGLAYLAVALAVAIRFGAIPFHRWAAPLTDVVPESTLPQVTAWAPAAFGIVALAWTEATVAPIALDLAAIRIVVLAVAIGSILLGSLAAWIQDDLEHMVGYAIVADAGVVLLALAAVDAEAAGPGRVWLLAFVVTRSAFAAWAAAARTTWFTGRVADLRGWAVRSPMLTVAFIALVVASVGIPGTAAFDARFALVRLSMDGPLQAVMAVGVLAPIAFYARLLAVGLSRAESGRAGRPEWRPSLTAVDLTDLRAWLGRTWAADRAFGASVGAIAVAVLAVAISAGAFGLPGAAANDPPAREVPTATPDVATPSFEPVPTRQGDASPGQSAGARTQRSISRS